MKSKKTSFLRKKPMQGAGGRALQFGLEAGATVGAAYASNSLLPDVAPKAHGPVLVALGLAAELFVEEPNVRAIGRGLGCYGALATTAKTLLPASAASFGLSGVEANDGSRGASDQDFWDKLAKQVQSEETDPGNEEKSMSGTDDDLETEQEESMSQNLQ
ncbi:MAG: hypothetical protein KKD31_14610 [Bacteroidetes bacterium]|nr:hypothetical protein [Bacteroidota bacterium]